MSAITPLPGSPLDLSIVVPVYNEEENLPLLWPEIREVLDPTGLRYEIVFVDDGSSDGSFAVLEELAARDLRDLLQARFIKRNRCHPILHIFHERGDR